MKQLPFPGFLDESAATPKSKEVESRSDESSSLAESDSTASPSATETYSVGTATQVVQSEGRSPEECSPLCDDEVLEGAAGELDALRVPLIGTSLIEASAGTGKTYAITTLYLRLLLERGLQIQEILVVTYTRAATAELRARIRGRLRQAQMAYQGGISEDEMVAALVCNRIASGHGESDLKAITNAISSFDQASIFSIHSFCQKILLEGAFESGMSFESSFVTEESALIEELCSDYWSSELYFADASKVRYLLRSKRPLTLERIIDVASKSLRHPTVSILPQEGERQELFAEWGRVQGLARRLWEESKEEIITSLTGSDSLNRNKYRIASIKGAWAEGMDRSLAATMVGVAPGFDKFQKFTNEGLAEGCKRGKTPPSHEFFDLCDELEDLNSKLGVYKTDFLVKLATYAREELGARKRALGLQSFDDLLLNVSKALAGDSQSPLALAVRKRFPAALIDEFQDTDPIQYGVFRCIYHASGSVYSLFLIGDPKQAIYGFRGADIFAYMKARSDAGDQRYTLGTNWRSDPCVVEAVNTIFTNRKTPFVFEEIEFRPVTAKPDAVDSLAGDLQGASGVEILFVARESDGRSLSKAWAQKNIPPAVAWSIASLLTGNSQIEGKEVVPGDIAVLVRKNSQARNIQDALRSCNIPSVVEGDASVFETEEAVAVTQLMLAMVEPNNSGRLVAALSSLLFQVTGGQLAAMKNADTEWDAWSRSFRKWYKRWIERGFVQAYREVLGEKQVAKRLLEQVGGERRLTNLYHLGELLQTQSMSAGMGPMALVRWMQRMRSDKRARSDSVGESGQIRLESDSDSVRIVTIHKSKGLEYPIVYCPYLWDGALLSKRDAEAFTFHNPESKNELYLDLGSDEMDAHHDMAAREAYAENLRLLYVAVTRAKHRCYLTWGAFKDSQQSPLGYLLHGPPEVEPSLQGMDTLFAAIAKKDDSVLLAELQGITSRSAGAISVENYTEKKPLWCLRAEESSESLQPRRANRSFFSNSRFSSFSSMMYQSSEEDGDERMRVQADASFIVEEAPRDMESEELVTLASFPKGTRVGLMMHSILETMDFGSTEVAGCIATCEQGLRQYRFDDSLAEGLASSLMEVVQTPLQSPRSGKQFSLSSLRPSSRIDEMEFLFPIQSKKGGVDGRRLSVVLEKTAESLFSKEYLGSIAQLQFVPLQGFMRGFIDLVFCHDELWYLADYKSNFLGEKVSSYQSESLDRAMDAHHYHLQYLVYLVALHRYLRFRLPDYRYESHIGGVYYFFLRGMSPKHSLGTGVFSRLPTEECIEALSSLLGEDKGSE